LMADFSLFSHLGRPALPTTERGLGSASLLPPDRYNTPIEDLNLSVRAYNCLKRSGLMTVGQVLEKSEDELLSLRNFGRKSYDELRDKLVEMGFLDAQPEGHEEGMMGNVPIGRATPASDGDGDRDAEDLSPLGGGLSGALRE